MEYTQLPRPINERTEDKSLFDRISVCPLLEEKRVHHLTNVHMTHSGVVMKNLQVLPASFHSEKEFIAKEAFKVAWYNLLTKPRKKINQPAVLGHTLWIPGYFPWIHNTLPRLFSIKEELNERVLLLPESCRRYESSLKPFSFKAIQYLPKSHRYKVKSLLLPDATGSGGWLGGNLLGGLRKRYQDYLNRNVPDQKEYAKRIFISRDDARVRRIKNTDALTNLLDSMNIQLVSLSKMPFWEQVATFYHAELIVGTHGAGLSNLLFAQQHARVLELFPTEAVQAFRHSYYEITSLLGLTYAYQFCPSHGEDPNIYNRDLSVGLPTLEKNIRLLLGLS